MNNNLVDKPVVVPGVGLLDSVDWGWKAPGECGQHHLMDWDLVLITLEKWAEHQRPSPYPSRWPAQSDLPSSCFCVYSVLMGSTPKLWATAKTSVTPVRGFVNALRKEMDRRAASFYKWSQWFLRLVSSCTFLIQLSSVRNLKNSYTGQYCWKVHLSWMHFLDNLLFLYNFIDEGHKRSIFFVWFSLVWFEVCYSFQFWDRSHPTAQGDLMFAIQPTLALNSWKSLCIILQSARYSNPHLKSLFSSINS